MRDPILLYLDAFPKTSLYGAVVLELGEYSATFITMMNNADLPYLLFHIGRKSSSWCKYYLHGGER
jgi:hypothetical protein